MSNTNSPKSYQVRVWEGGKWVHYSFHKYYRLAKGVQGRLIKQGKDSELLKLK